MKNESDIEFTASPTLPQGVDFKPETNRADGTNGEAQAAGAPLDQAREKAQRLVSTAQERAVETVQARFDEQKIRACELSAAAGAGFNGRMTTWRPSDLRFFLGLLLPALTLNSVLRDPEHAAVGVALIWGVIALVLLPILPAKTGRKVGRLVAMWAFRAHLGIKLVTIDGAEDAASTEG